MKRRILFTNLDMDSNYKGKFNLDHVYCHTNESNNYLRANNAGSGTSADAIALRKENQQIKSMLLYNLDLIGLQNEQLQAKERLLASLREENEALKSKVERLELEKKLQQQQKPNPGITNEDKKENLPEVSNKGEKNVSRASNRPTESTAKSEEKYKIRDCSDEGATNESNGSIIGESNGKLISKIILHRIHCPEKNERLQEHDLKTLKTKKDLSAAAKISKKSLDMKVDSDESLSCDSIIGHDQFSKYKTHGKKYSLLHSNREYSTREWEDEEFTEEFNLEEAEALRSDEPMLEIPKWSIKEFTGLYSIEGTEDLSDESFLKRHSKWEHDEKKRKKWDVQRIREQKNIERLKRRHCKDELQEAAAADNREITSFYPLADSVKYIQIVEDLPVQAFGEGIPRLANSDFMLPWSVAGGTHHHHQTTELQLNSQQQSSFVFLKKRRRQQGLAMTIGKRNSTKLAASTVTASNLFIGPAPPPPPVPVSVPVSALASVSASVSVPTSATVTKN